MASALPAAISSALRLSLNSCLMPEMALFCCWHNKVAKHAAPLHKSLYVWHALAACLMEGGLLSERVKDAASLRISGLAGAASGEKKGGLLILEPA
jgi:hypothetical protein